MLRFRYPLIFIIFIIFNMLIGCSTRQPIQLVDATGRQLPTPHYRVQTISYPIGVVFYYTSYKIEEDVDGTPVYTPKYLSLSHHDIITKNFKGLTLTIEVQNPKEIEYSLYEHVTIFGKEVRQRQNGKRTNTSNMNYRQYVFILPYGEEVLEVEHYVSLIIDDNELMRIGHFQYKLIH